MDIHGIVEKQRDFFNSGATKPVAYRIRALKRLRLAIKSYEQDIYEALKTDLNKSEFESYMTEIGLVLDEIKTFIRHTKEWSARKRVKTPLAQFAASSYVYAEPYGVVLIMSPWNYPFQLSIAPLIGAMAAGNCIILKPSEYAPNVSKVMARMLKSFFPSKYIQVVTGGRQKNQELLEEKFDYIFFTGGSTVGRLVMEKAARHLTPVSLELGGKSPCIVDKTADLALAAKRIAFGKFINSGQTCVAPDYLYVHKDVKSQLIHYLIKYLSIFFGDEPLSNPDYPKIINAKHYNRLMGLMEGETVITGGYGKEGQFIAPTILDDITPESKIMQEEIFGPILPIMTYESMNEVIDYVRNRPKPLALYLFTTNRKLKDQVLREVSFGGGCINDTIIHLATPYMGFGGVGESGMGSYHGKCSFDTFSHKKSIVKKANWIDLPMRYHPYTKGKERIVHFFLR